MTPNNLTKIILALILCLSLNSFAQTEINNCEVSGVISGDIHGHLFDCTSEILITSTAAEGSTGTILTGTIETKKLIILPGYSKVRILAPDHFANKTHKKKKTSIGSIGSGGGGGKMDTNAHQHEFNNDLIFYPNPAKKTINFSYYKDLIQKYEITNMRGVIMYKGIFSKQTVNHEVNIEKLKKGFYIVNMTFTTGVIVSKVLIKE